jgi:CheY-like chemotaxis protein
VPNVLVVEDEPACRYTTAKALLEAGYDVVSAASYQQALEIITSDRPLDLLLADIVSPGGMNGFALGRMARVRRKDLRILYMTAYDVPKEEALGKILQKPITDEQLVMEVSQALAA